MSLVTTHPIYLSQRLKPNRPQCGHQTQPITYAGLVPRTTYLEEPFHSFQRDPDSAKPIWKDVVVEESITLGTVDHIALPVDDVEECEAFYVKLLGFQSVPRVGLPFDGRWLQGGGITLHLIARDPTVPFSYSTWEDSYKEAPQPWFERRAKHISFMVPNFSKAQELLQKMNIDHDLFMVPDKNLQQMFFFDPAGNSVELLGRR